MTRPLALHPLLFFLAIVLFFCAHNPGRLSLQENWQPMVWLLMPMLVIEAMVLRMRRARMVAVLFSLFVVLFFSYGQVFDVLQDLQWNGWRVRHSVLMLTWAALFTWGTRAALRAKSDLANLTRVLNFVSLILIAVPVAQIAAHSIGGGVLWSWSRPAPPLVVQAGEPATQTNPDIYYIILDRYANEETLRASYGLDNTEFLQFLREKGFLVASESYSNYPKTALSLASSLNLGYIDDLSSDPGRESSDWVPVHSRLRDYRVWRFLKSRGYTFIHFGTRWEPTRINPNADVNVNVFTPPEMIWALAGQTVLHPIGSELGIGLFDQRVLEWERIPYQLEKLPGIARDPRPTFAFVHLLIPHGPYVFERDGSFLPEETATQRSRRENYRNQLLYANRKVREAIGRLLADSPTPPVIILQGDEGPIPIGYPREGLKFHWEAATDAELREKAGILNAYYLPGVKSEKVYPSISPVNSFRLIFNEYFHTKLPMLRDEHYFPKDDHHPYDFFDATQRLKKRPQQTLMSRSPAQARPE